LLITAAAVLVDDHVTEEVRSCVELSEYVPMAANCCVKPLAITEFEGVIAMDTSDAESTVSAALPLMLPLLAVMLALPGLVELARPLKPAALLIVATLGLFELQVTELLMFKVELSE